MHSSWSWYHAFLLLPKTANFGRMCDWLWWASKSHVAKYTDTRKRSEKTSAEEKNTQRLVVWFQIFLLGLWLSLLPSFLHDPFALFPSLLYSQAFFGGFISSVAVSTVYDYLYFSVLCTLYFSFGPCSAKIIYKASGHCGQAIPSCI